ncbi:MAG: cell filamentation protein Fic [Armatimonadetes bacterium CG_4_9_14_3_um_filter_58_7]|nr:MAG: cell filamentation protein Fic [Armatimonadetes bacterium CG_4_9_14_3_um_filter_58_7]
MRRKQTGEYTLISTVGEEARAFVPAPLPPSPPLVVTGDLRDSLDEALLELGRLDGITTILPDTGLFLYMYIRKEAVLSSQIEGTQSSLSDLLLFEVEGAPGAPIEDVREVSNYIAAMEHGLARLREGFPLCNRLLREVHERLLAKGRGEDKTPGELRRTQNWIGGSRPGNARFVPPPPERLNDCMGDLERFLNDQPERTPALLKAALAHVQFETIHPFLDGNGRLGRLLIALLLCHEKVLREPMLYLSLFFKQHRQEYYDLLQQVRIEGEWEAWLTFFVEAVRTTAQQAVSTADQLSEVLREDRDKVRLLGRIAGSALRMMDVLAQRPVLSVAVACQSTGMVASTVTKAISKLASEELVKELTGQKRNRLFCYDRYLQVLAEGTEPLT